MSAGARCAVRAAEGALGVQGRGARGDPGRCGRGGDPGRFDAREGTAAGAGGAAAGIVGLARASGRRPLAVQVGASGRRPIRAVPFRARFAPTFQVLPGRFRRNSPGRRRRGRAGSRSPGQELTRAHDAPTRPRGMGSGLASSRRVLGSGGPWPGEREPALPRCGDRVGSRWRYSLGPARRLPLSSDGVALLT